MPRIRPARHEPAHARHAHRTCRTRTHARQVQPVHAMSAPPDLQLERDAFGRLVFTDAAGLRHEGVVPVRAFPLAAPDEGLSLVGHDGSELAWIARLATLPDSLRALIDDELASREFTPVILRLRSVSTYSTPSTWEVDTDRGETRLVLGRRGHPPPGGRCAAHCRQPGHPVFGARPARDGPSLQAAARAVLVARRRVGRHRLAPIPAFPQRGQGARRQRLCGAWAGPSPALPGCGARRQRRWALPTLVITSHPPVGWPRHERG